MFSDASIREKNENLKQLFGENHLIIFPSNEKCLDTSYGDFKMMNKNLRKITQKGERKLQDLKEKANKLQGAGEQFDPKDMNLVALY